jgi:hypothetical protein
VLIVIAQACVALGAAALVASLTFAIASHPRLRAGGDYHDTVAFVPVGPADGQLIRVEGRVVVDAPLRGPSGLPCALYELYAGDGSAARALRRRGVRFVIDDGIFPVRIDPALKLTVYDLPTEVIAGPESDERLLIERRLQAGARVQAVGCVWRQGAPGHEELTLVPPDSQVGVAITFLSA